MWNKQAMTGEAPKKGLFRKILLMILVCILVLTAVGLFVFRKELHLDHALRRLKYWNASGGEIYFFDAHNSNRYASFDGGLAVASAGGLSTYDSDGREAVISQSKLSLPEIQTGGDMVMAYDVGGNTLLAIHKSGGEVLRVTSDKPILDADLSQGGDICYLSSEAGYKSVLTVYNEQQERIYRWLSTSTFLSLCAISDNGKDLAAIGLDQRDGSFVSTLNLFRTDTDQLINTVVLGDDLIYDLMYLDSDLLCAVGESCVIYISAAGEILGTYDFGGRYFKDHNASGEGFLALSMNTYRAGNRYSLVLVDETGSELGSVYVGQEILDISAAGKYIAVLTPQKLTIYDRKLTVYAETDDTGSATAVLMQSDGVAMLLGSGSGRLYIP